MSFRNRCVIAGGGGPVNLSIPLVEGRNQRRLSKEVRIDNKTDWQGQHWKTITSCYNRSPWFEFYKHELEILYQQPTNWLFEWNRACWDWVVGKLSLEIGTGWSEGPVVAGPVGSPKDQVGVPMNDTGIPAQPGIRYLDWRNKLLPKTIGTEFPEPIRYRQVFEDRTGFLPHLSILDLLFCEGRRTVEILESAKIPI